MVVGKGKHSSSSGMFYTLEIHFEFTFNNHVLPQTFISIVV